jgi:hypothetical protein
MDSQKLQTPFKQRDTLSMRDTMLPEEYEESRSPLKPREPLGGRTAREADQREYPILNLGERIEFGGMSNELDPANQARFLDEPVFRKMEALYGEVKAQSESGREYSRVVVDEYQWTCTEELEVPQDIKALVAHGKYTEPKMPIIRRMHSFANCLSYTLKNKVMLWFLTETDQLPLSTEYTEEIGSIGSSL